MVERDLLIGRGLVGGENAAEDVGPGGSATDIWQLLEPERLHNFVELLSGVQPEVPEQEGPALVEQRLDVRPPGLDGSGQ